MKHRFIVEMETDGMDFPSDMEGIARDLERFFPYIANKYVHTESIRVIWKLPPSPRKKKEATFRKK